MKVIIALDDSPYSRHIIDAVVSRHWPANTNFKILTVIEPVSSADEARTDSFTNLFEVEKKRLDFAEALCERARNRLMKEIPNAVVHSEIRKGSPRTEIVNAAVDWMSDKILVGAHGLGICPRNLLGSVSRSVAQQSPCSVEIVRGDLNKRDCRQSETLQKN